MVQGSSTKSSKWVRHNQVSWSSFYPLGLKFGLLAIILDLTSQFFVCTGLPMEPVADKFKQELLSGAFPKAYAMPD